MKIEKRMIFGTLVLFLTLMTMACVTTTGDLSILYSDKAPKPIGPYSQAIVANGFIFAAGQIAINPETGKLVEPDITVQTKQVLENLKAVLKAAGASLNDVVKVSVFLQNPKDFKPMNKVYATYFKDHKPARTTVPGVEWKPGILIEIDVIAATQ